MMEGPPWNLSTVSAPLYYQRHGIPSLELRNRTNIFLLLVYYKLFDEKRQSEVRHPIYSNNPYIGRVDANVIPPPHNAASLVQCICAKEGKGFGIDYENGDAYSTELYKTISSPVALILSEPLPLLSAERPGSKPQEPMVLKVAYEGMLKSTYLPAAPL